MFLKILEKLGRKKIVLDRGPSHPRFSEAKPWMNRYYVLFRHRPRWFPFNILIHEMLADDHGEGVHNHPFPYVTVILRGTKPLTLFFCGPYGLRKGPRSEYGIELKSKKD